MDAGSDVPLLPARMVNEYVYCPRLAYLMWVQGEWRDSADTVDGRYTHRRVDKPGGALPAAPDGEERIHARSVTLASDALGVVARLDLIEGEGERVMPVDYKRGKRPHVACGVYDPERVQLCLQGLLLRERGYACDSGVVYYAGSRERVPVAFDDELVVAARAALDGLRGIAARGELPPPLVDSPKCPRCALVGICLPDETNWLRGAQQAEPRPLAVARDTALPLYVQAPYAKVGKSGEVLEVQLDDDTRQSARLIDVSQLVLMGNAYVSTPALHELMRREIPVTWHSYGGWFIGHSVGTGHRNVELRTAQFKASFDAEHCLRLARGWVAAKIANGRTFLRRNWKDDAAPEALLDALKGDIDRARRAGSLEALLGIEGMAAARYFGAFGKLLRPPMRQDAPAAAFDFDFDSRNRRPPTDPVNALLSYAYSLLTRTWTVTLSAVGFDPYRGFYHQPRYGRPALALDMMEPFRPLIADSIVIQAINNGEVQADDFVRSGAGVALKDEGRKRFIAAFERRMSHEVTHPLFGYRVSYRRLLELQARLLGRHLSGELVDYPNFTTR